MILELNEKLKNNHDKFRLFGIILFTEEHPAVIKTLKDKDYYAAIDQISGKNILVIASMLFRGHYDYPCPPPGVLSQMMPVWVEPNENKRILPWFDIEDSRKLPVFVLFAFDGIEIYYQIHPLENTDERDVFNSLKDVLSIISREVQTNIHIRNRELFKKAQWQIKKVHAIKKIKELLGVVGLFRGATGV